jgi:hypothetical protein
MIGRITPAPTQVGRPMRDYVMLEDGEEEEA